MAKNKPQIVDVPRANYIAVRGKGNPNEENGEYQQAISALYAVAYTLKMSYKTVAVMDKFLEDNGYENDMNDKRFHHEIYMSDARKVSPEKWKTVIRHPIRKRL